MKKKIGIFGFLMLFAFSSVIQADDTTKEKTSESDDPIAVLAADGDTIEFEYLKLVMGVFRSHLKALELLTEKENKYYDNVVRHALAIQSTTDLLEHFYPGDTSMEHEKLPWKNKKEFEERAKTNREAAEDLSKAASDWLEDQDRQKFLNSLEVLKESCRNCHRELKNWP